MVVVVEAPPSSLNTTSAPPPSPNLTHLTHLPCRLQFPDPGAVSPISSLTPSTQFLINAICPPPPTPPSPVLSVLSSISLANTQRWSFNKGACAAGARLSTTLMVPLFRAAPEETYKLHFSPLRALSTLFLMHSSNPSESYHAALPCSLNKSSPPLPPAAAAAFPPRPPTSAPLPPVSPLSPPSDASPRAAAAICCLQLPHMYSSNAPQ